MEKLLAILDPQCLASLFVFETAKVFYECVVHLSASQKQEEAKCTLNFAYRILDWIPLVECAAVESSLSDNSLFPSRIPLRKLLQILIKKSCVPPMNSLESLDEKPSAVAKDSGFCELEKNVEKHRLEGNKSFKHGQYKEAVDAYSTAIDMSRGTPVFNALLLTNRASAYIKLNKLDDALKDANEYISRFPDCWKGYARKALALREKVSAEIAAAIAYYHCYEKDGICIFSEYKPFTDAFSGLKERIDICNTVLQLNDALASCNTEDLDCLRVLVLGSKEYIINANTTRILWRGSIPCIFVNNCIIVGTKPDCSVSLKLEGNASLDLYEKCMFTNLSFAIKKGQINGYSGSWVKFHNCHFTSNSDILAAVSSNAVFNAERCHFFDCKAGGLLCVGPGNMVVDNCIFAGNAKAGLEVRENGTLTVRNSRMYYNHWDGLTIGPTAAKCDVFDCQIYHNDREGVAVLDASKRVTLMRNHIFGNDENGIFVRNSEVDMRENKFFDNESWGIWSQSNSWCKVSMNEVFRNKRGGVRVGKRLAGEEFPHSVVELNKVYENFGPAVVDTINNFEDPRLAAWESNVSETNGDFKSAKYDRNVKYNNRERSIVNQSKSASSWCSGCFGKCENLKRCGKCFTAGYCNANCQTEHWSNTRNCVKFYARNPAS